MRTNGGGVKLVKAIWIQTVLITRVLVTVVSEGTVKFPVAFTAPLLI